jgi:nitrogen fixation/metabolism regulation signal transduction histidine kinase
MRLVNVGQPELDSLIDIYNQMIDKLRQERTLQQEQHFFLDKLILASPAGVIILDYDEKINMINPTAEGYIGCRQDEMKGLPLASIPSPLSRELSEILIGETRVIQLSGLKKFKVHKSYFTNRGFRNIFLVIEELTDEIYSAEHAAYEKVIRTISHEFNNSIGPINSILSSLKFYSGELTSGHRVDFENAIDVAIDRNLVLNTFVKRYAEVFKLPQPLKERCNVNDLMTRMEKIFYMELQAKNIQLKTNYTKKPLMVNLDVHQMELVVTNIVKNAIEAIENDGVITFDTNSTPARLVIQNNGTPIPTQVKKQLFSPFFSTKKTGQGIGLTLVREILNNHSFTFSLETKDDGMTEFWVEF